MTEEREKPRESKKVGEEGSCLERNSSSAVRNNTSSLEPSDVVGSVRYAAEEDRRGRGNHLKMPSMMNGRIIRLEGVEFVENKKVQRKVPSVKIMTRKCLGPSADAVRGQLRCSDWTSASRSVYLAAAWSIGLIKMTIDQ